MLIKQNNNGTTTIADPSQLKKVMNYVNRWYNVKDPFEKSSVKGLTKTELMLQSVKSKPNPQSNRNQILKKQTNIKKIKNPLTSKKAITRGQSIADLDSLYSDEDFVMQVSDSDDSFKTDEEEDLILDSKNKGLLMQKLN